MEQNEAKSQSVYSEMQRSHALVKEFESLRPKWWQPLGKLVSFMVLIFFSWYLFPEVAEQPVIYLLMIVVFIVSMESFNENKRLNRRIDLLHRMIKENV